MVFNWEVHVTVYIATCNRDFNATCNVGNPYKAISSDKQGRKPS